MGSNYIFVIAKKCASPFPPIRAVTLVNSAANGKWPLESPLSLKGALALDYSYN